MRRRCARGSGVHRVCKSRHFEGRRRERRSSLAAVEFDADRAARRQQRRHGRYQMGGLIRCPYADAMFEARQPSKCRLELVIGKLTVSNSAYQRLARRRALARGYSSGCRCDRDKQTPRLSVHATGNELSGAYQRLRDRPEGGDDRRP